MDDLFATATNEGGRNAPTTNRGRHATNGRPSTEPPCEASITEATSKPSHNRQKPTGLPTPGQPEPKTERRRFGMHEDLLFSVITRQAGTLSKAVLESIMNSIDAAATKIDIQLSQEAVNVRDNGHGFKSRDEVERFFEVFGTPHTEGDSKHGFFRMGRGQCFAFGKNTWSSNRFRMNVDIKAKGLDYDLVIDAREQPGCEVDIELYERLTVSRLDELLRDIAKWAAWTGVETTLNSRTVSKDPTKEKWDTETEQAYFKFSSSGVLDVYNLGVFVREQGCHRYGTGGTVVSKKRMKVNFARNDVQSDCPVWRKIEDTLRTEAGTKVERKPKITDGERDYLAKLIRSGTKSFASCIDFAVFTDVDGKNQTLKHLAYKTCFLSNGKKGDLQAVVAQQSNPSNLIVAEETLRRFSVDSANELIEILIATFSKDNQPGYVDMLKRIECIPLERMTASISSEHATIPENKLTKVQRQIQKALQNGLTAATKALNDSRTLEAYLPLRAIKIGRSAIAQAWTNGSTTIWVNERSLPLMATGITGCTRLAGLLIHELMHQEADTDTHQHDHEFYEQFHDLMLDTDAAGQAANAMMLGLNRCIREAGNKPSKKIGFFESLQDGIEHEASKTTKES